MRSSTGSERCAAAAPTWSPTARPPPSDRPWEPGRAREERADFTQGNLVWGAASLLRFRRFPDRSSAGVTGATPTDPDDAGGDPQPRSWPAADGAAGGAADRVADGAEHSEPREERAGVDGATLSSSSSSSSSCSSAALRTRSLPIWWAEMISFIRKVYWLRVFSFLARGSCNACTSAPHVKPCVRYQFLPREDACPRANRVGRFLSLLLRCAPLCAKGRGRSCGRARSTSQLSRLAYRCACRPTAAACAGCRGRRSGTSSGNRHKLRPGPWRPSSLRRSGGAAQPLGSKCSSWLSWSGARRASRGGRRANPGPRRPPDAVKNPVSLTLHQGGNVPLSF